MCKGIYEDYDRHAYTYAYRYDFYDITSCAHGRELNVEKRRENTCRICLKTTADFMCFYLHRQCILLVKHTFFFVTTSSEK